MSEETHKRAMSMASKATLLAEFERHQIMALSHPGSTRTVGLLGMQMCIAAHSGDLHRFNQDEIGQAFNLALGWPDPWKFAPPDLGWR
jgi:hypothetical protein